MMSAYAKKIEVKSLWDEPGSEFLIAWLKVVNESKTTKGSICGKYEKLDHIDC